VPGSPRSQRLIGVESTGVGDYAGFTCPPDTVVLVKSAFFWNHAPIAASASLSCSVDGTANITYLVYETMDVNAGFAWEGWAVLNPGDAVFVSFDTGGLTAWVSGAVLLGAPPFPPATLGAPASAPFGLRS
jgi:hypothetical protein